MLKLIIISILVLMVILAGLYFYFAYVPAVKQPPLTATAQKNTINAGGIARTFTSYHPAKTAVHPALLIVLHGTNINGDKIREWTGYEFDEMADRQGFLVVYANGYGNDWNDCRKGIFSKTKRENIDDVGFLTAIISQYKEKYAIDPSKIYLFGYSSGGIMAFRMGIAHPELVAGIATICSAFPTAETSICTPHGQMPRTMLVNGTADKICPVEGGELNLFGKKRGQVMSAQATASQFAGSQGTPEKVRLPHANPEDPTYVDRFTWTKEGRAVVELYLVNGGGHVVPQPKAKFPRIMGRMTGDLDAPATAVSFFGL